MAESILVVGDSADPHPELIVGELRRRGVEPLVLDQSKLPASRMSLTLRSPNALEGRITSSDDRSLRLADITGVAYWPAWVQIEVPTMSEEARLLSEDEWWALLGNLAYLTPNARWVNPIWMRMVGNPKLHQLRRAQSLGLTIPESLITNSPEAARAFVVDHPKGVANKRLANLLRPIRGRALNYRLLTTVIDSAMLSGVNPESITYAPVFFQEYVPKQVEIRSYVFGDRVLSAEILSQEDPETAVDWRNYPMTETPEGPDIDTSRWKCRTTELPSGVESKLVRLVSELGLVFSAVDLIRKPNGEYVFLEANYGGAFGWIQDLTGLPLLERFVDLVLRPPS